jgi:multiple sugar transport system permease protein
MIMRDKTVQARAGRPTPPRTRSRRRRYLVALGFILPAALYIVVFFGYPLVYNLAMSFQDYTPRSFYTGEAPFVGLDNYRKILSSPIFQPAVLHTIVFTVGSIVFQFGIGLALAVYFNRRFPLSNLLRAMLLLPWLLPLIVSSAIWRWMFDKDFGVINYFIRLLPGVDTGAPWLTNGKWALAAVVIANIWIGIPFNMVILYGGLQGIAETIYEAAKLDGASAWQCFRYMTWPLLKPVTLVVLMLGLVYTIKVFDVIMGLTGGGPANQTQTLTTWSYQYSFSLFQFGPGAAVSSLLALVAAIIALFYLRSLRRSSDGS